MREGTQKLELHIYIRWRNNLTVLVMKKSLIHSSRRDLIVCYYSAVVLLQLVSFACVIIVTSLVNQLVLPIKDKFLPRLFSWVTISSFLTTQGYGGLPGLVISTIPRPPPRQHKHERRYTPSTHPLILIRRIWKGDYDNQMIFGDLACLKLPDNCLTGEENPRKKATQET